MSALRALLEGAIDYAGLFPPAALSMPRAVEAYSVHRLSPEAWMLGRFVVPAARLEELARAAAPHLPERGQAPWPLSALLGEDPQADLGRVLAFNEAHAGRACVDVVEGKAGDERAAAALTGFVSGLPLHVELPIDGELSPILEALRRGGARAKIRTGGLVPEAIPSTAELARFLCACHAAALPFKATAGLHHAVRGSHPLTASAEGPRGTLHGFLNLLAAAVFARAGHGEAQLEALLRDERPASFRFDDQLGWNRMSVTAAQVAEARRTFALGFGSCSFAEPVGDLRALGLL